MEYQIVEAACRRSAARRGRTVVARFDSAYTAVEAVRTALRTRDQRARRWYVLDLAGRVLAGPDDLVD